MDFKDYIAITEDFPTKGISFKDMSPLLRNPEAFKKASDQLSDYAREMNPTVIIGPEARGFIFGTVIAYNLGLGFVMARKDGKLPGKTLQAKYSLEYGYSCINLPWGSIKKGDRVVLVDDLLATGGTLDALVRLCNDVGAEVVGCITLIELTKVRSDKFLKGINVKSLIQYDF